MAIFSNKISSLLRREDSKIGSISRDVNKFFDSILHRLDFSDAPETESGSALQPRVNIAENDDSYHIMVELPGVLERDIELSMSQNILNIRGEKKQEKEFEDQSFYRLECTYGSFHRNIHLPTRTDSDKAIAHFENGILRVVLPKAEIAQKATHRISIGKDIKSGKVQSHDEVMPLSVRDNERSAAQSILEPEHSESAQSPKHDSGSSTKKIRKRDEASAQAS